MKKIILPKLDIYTPLQKSNQIINEDYDVDNYLHYPILIEEDGIPWKHGNLYILSKLKNYKKPSSKTLDSIANDLKDFMLWCKESDIDYLTAKRKVLTPTYKYRGYLQTLYENGKISSSTLKRKIGSVIGFYRYLINEQNIKFNFPLWEEGITSITYFDNKGFSQSKNVITTDIAKAPLVQNQEITNEEFIKDGGNLKPLTENEQVSIIKALLQIDNKEMTLGFLISMFTGARISSVYSLRLKHFKKNIDSESKDDITMKIGLGTDCDTKGDKQYLLYFPLWLYQMIKIYIQSPKSVIKREKAKHIFDDYDKQYVFLNNRGRPYYVSKYDPYKQDYRDIPNGNTVRLFILNTLQKTLKKNNKNINFSFHDLRATFGMNTLNRLLPLVKSGEIDISFALHYVKERMGHSSLITTERYLNFQKLNQVKLKVQNGFEEHLAKLILNEL
ncbi:tyrosine-type recombinase/integrase [Aliarcobacter butzleri]|uniref:tyrosine-type recombinase/integrase n=1 Tax=Aliarcobacter butzleri TaxID=28197 RepID=UPI0021B48894|nr:site-specific integrase [Aliarcobacter butzleri]MCT7557568.1 tyrosine-type recombinase/integrase [Aliarcobacter butzleri]